MPAEKINCPITGQVCSELTLLHMYKDLNPVSGELTIEDEDGVHVMVTEDDPYKEVQSLIEWTKMHPEDCLERQELGKIGCGAALGIMGYFNR